LNFAGRQSDKYGNLAQWWSKSTIDTYLEKAQCFIEQYSMYRVPELDELLHTEVMVSDIFQSILFLRKLRQFARLSETHVSLGAFTASELEVVFSGYQPH
jgi:hypothetical protein